MVLNKEDVEKLVLDSIANMKNDIGKQIEDEMEKRIRWELEEVVANTVREYLKEEIVPMLKVVLEGNKAKILEGLTLEMSNVDTKLNKMMTEIFDQQISSKYKRDAIIKALFGVF